MNFNKFIIFMLVLLTCLVSISAVSAADTNNSSDNILSTSMSDISVSDVSDSLNTNEMSDASKNNTGEEKSVLSVFSSDKTKDSFVNTLKESESTFSDIQNLIDTATGDSINLTESYYAGDGTQIKINKPITINGNGAILDAKGLSKIFEINADNVNLKNITFINGHCEYSEDYAGTVYWNGANGTITDCSFTNCSSYEGSAIHWDGDNGTVSGCNFTNCNAIIRGGAIHWYGDNGRVTNCSFTNCSSYDGGAIYWEANSTVTNCSFTNCNAIVVGGAIRLYGDNGTVTDCNFSNCTAGSAGGAIDYWGANGTVTNCNFTNCITIDYDSPIHTGGGAIYYTHRYFLDAGNITVLDCSFTNCTVPNNSSAIYLDGNNNGTVSNCTFYFVEGSFNGHTVIYGDVLIVNGTLKNDTSIFGLNYTKTDVMVNDNRINVSVDNDTGVISNANFGSLSPGVYEAVLMDDHNNAFVLANNTYAVKISTIFTNPTKGKLYNDNDYYKVMVMF